MMRLRFEILDFRAIVGFFILLGSAFVVIGGIWMHRTSEFRTASLRAEGVVVEMVNIGRGRYAPVFEFDDQTGRRHRIYFRHASNPPRFEAGEQVQVLYAPDDPAGARIDSLLGLWLGPGIFVLLGSTFVVVAGLVGWYLWRSDRPFTGQHARARKYS